jgi:hypothetical protein
MIFHVFYTEDLPEFVVKDHKACCQKIGIEVKYHSAKPNEDFNVIYKAHGELINNLLENASENEVVCMLDIDCLPYSFDDLKQCYSWAKNNVSFIGNAQNISHTRLKNRIFAAASMLMIHKKAWITLGKPDLFFSKDKSDDSLIDTAQQLSLSADEVGFPYRTLLPLGYDDRDRSWQLGTLCAYGRGTTYPGSWHFFRISDLKNGRSKIWDERVADILAQRQIMPLYQSLNNSFEREKPLLKKISYKLKKLFK